MNATVIETIAADRAVALVRLQEIPDPVALASALVDGGIRAVEFTFTTPGVEEHIAAVRAAVSDEAPAGSSPVEMPGTPAASGPRHEPRLRSVVGAGTVLTARQAEAAIRSGAEFLVTPGISVPVADTARQAGVPLLMGAFTPSEVIRALELGAAAVKVFPAQTAGPAYFRHLSGPFPGVPLIGSGGLDAGNARSYLEAGAWAVTAGSSVITRADVLARDWAAVTERARAFVAALSA